MTDVQQHAKNSIAAKLERLERLCGRFPVLSSENRQDFEELLISLLEHYRPRNFLGERLIKYLTDEEWEIGRYKRHKTLLIERRFRARLAFQAYREKAAKENKAALANKLAEHRGQFVLPEEALEGVVAEVDAMLLRPAEELEHARALEVASVYFAHLDRLLNAAIVRRNAILAEIDRYDYLFDPAHTLTALVEEVHESGYGPQCKAQASEAHGKELPLPPLVPNQERNA
jgi:hypothetical protein